MPPSGFFEKHSRPIAAFFRGCVEDLIVENRGVRTPELAIERELRHIKTDIAASDRGPIPTKLLELTKSFYESLLSKKAKDFDELELHAEQLIDEIERDIEAIKIADTV